MIKEKEKRFYAAVGQALTRAREHRKLTITKLGELVNEQYNTIKNIEAGGIFSFHHFLWMRYFLGIDFDKITKSMEGKGDKRKGIDDLI